eukprot:UC1_evm1s1899
MDQRGAGRSRPHACLEENTTWHLVADIERLRTHLHIDRWAVFGGSWGSTLSLSYAETHPDRVIELILRGIFTLRRKELIWFYQEGASFIFPDTWESYLKPIPDVERADMMSAYYRRLTGSDEAEQLACAKAWSTWECATARLAVDPAMLAKGTDPRWALAFARIECHYFINGGFFEEDGQLIKNAGILANIPTTIVQGRYDVVCPMRSAWDLHRALPSAKLIVVNDAGHSTKEPGIRTELIQACDRLRDKVRAAAAGGGAAPMIPAPVVAASPSSSSLLLSVGAAPPAAAAAAAAAAPVTAMAAAKIASPANGYAGTPSTKSPLAAGASLSVVPRQRHYQPPPQQQLPAAAGMSSGAPASAAAAGMSSAPWAQRPAGMPAHKLPAAGQPMESAQYPGTHYERGEHLLRAQAPPTDVLNQTEDYVVEHRPALAPPGGHSSNIFG